MPPAQVDEAEPIGLLVGGALIDATSGSTTIALLGLSLVVVSAGFAAVGAMRRASLPVVVR